MSKDKKPTTVTITRNIQIIIDEPDEVLFKEKYKRLYDMRHQTFRAANMIVSQQWLNFQLQGSIMKSEGYAKAAEAKEVIKKVYDTGIENSTYQLISKEYPELPSCVRSSLNRAVVKIFNANLKEVLCGKRTLSNYRLGMPIPFNMSDSMRIEKALINDKQEYRFIWTKGINFILRLGKDRSNNQAIVDRIITGEYKFCDSEIQIKDNKIFLLLTVTFPKSIVQLDYTKTAATNLGMNCPVFLTASTGQHLSIGSKEEFWAVRMQMQKRYTSIQESLKTARAGHGRERKLKALNHLSETERNFAKTYNHKLSKQIVMFCVNNGIGNIKTEDMLGGAETFNKSIILRNWSYFELQSQIEYKAAMYNINVLKINPENITRTCNCCKNVSRTAVDLKERKYICDNTACAKFNKPVDVDMNASLNLLEKEIEEKGKEDKKDLAA